MNPKHRKILLICIGIVVGSYIVRNIVIGAMQIAYYQRQAQIRQRQKPKPKPKPAPPPVASAPAATAPPATARRVAPARPKPVPIPPSPFAKLSGIWQGRAAIDGRGICELKFELREESPGRYSGFSSMTCNGAGQLMPGRRVNARARMLNVMDPESAILSGVLEKGSIEFHVEKTVGTDSNGCAPTSFSLTPFGANQLAAEWQEGSCTGGHVIMRRARG